MKDIKSIDIVLENCESFTIPYKYVHRMVIHGFDKNILIQSNDGRCFDYSSSDYVYLQIENSPEIKADMNFSTPFDKRIFQYNDITQITMRYVDDEEFNFCVPWGGDDEYTNDAQTVKINKYGYIEIEISDEKEKEEILDLENE